MDTFGNLLKGKLWYTRNYFQYQSLCWHL